MVALRFVVCLGRGTTLSEFSSSRKMRVVGSLWFDPHKVGMHLVGLAFPSMHRPVNPPLVSAIAWLRLYKEGRDAKFC